MIRLACSLVFLATSALAEPFGLNDYLGVSMGMPLDEAVAVLEERGYVIDPDPGTLEEGLRGLFRDTHIKVSHDPSRGLVVPEVRIERSEGVQVVRLFGITSLKREEGGIEFHVSLRSSAPQVDATELGEEAVYDVALLQLFPGPIDLAAVEQPLRDAAGVPPTCVDASAAGDTATASSQLIWALDDGEAQAPQGDCSGDLLAIQTGVSPAERLQQLLDGPEAAPPWQSYLRVSLQTSEDGASLTAIRRDGRIERASLEAALNTDAIVAPAVPATGGAIVDF